MDAPTSELDPQRGGSSDGVVSGRQSTLARQSGGSKRRNREHTNSRSGCAQCKARKVKASTSVPIADLVANSIKQCDEEKPKCRAWYVTFGAIEVARIVGGLELLIGRRTLTPSLASSTRRTTPCTYSNEINGLNQLASAASAASSPHDRPDSCSFTPIQSAFGTTTPTGNTHSGASFTPIQSEFGTATLPNGQLTASFTPIQQELRTITLKNDNTRANGPRRLAASSPLSLNLAHMELLHHFVAVTSHALSFGPLGHDVWHMIIPQIALSHDWLMHSILAISALHIAHLNPDQRDTYWKRAAIHQDQALQGQQRALANPSIDNGDALFAFTLTVIYLAFAGPNASESSEEAPLQGLIRCKAYS